MVQDSQAIVKRNRKVDGAGQPNNSQTEPESRWWQDSQTIVKQNRKVDGAGCVYIFIARAARFCCLLFESSIIVLFLFQARRWQYGTRITENAS